MTNAMKPESTQLGRKLVSKIDLKTVIEQTEKEANCITKRFGVYKGITSDEKDFVIKRMKKMHGKDKYDELFEIQVKIMKKLNHQNIIKLINHTPLISTQNDSDERYPYNYNYMVTEYCAGGTLLNRLDKVGSFSEETVKEYFQQIIDGVLHMKEKGIVHRDLNLENILLVKNDPKSTDIKIIDFDHSFDCDTNTGDLNIVGSHQYIAPESSQTWKAETFC
jgi:serine/threonine protein kinase